MELATSVILITTLLLADPVTPEIREKAREHSKQATVAYNLGDYDEAAAHYEIAYRLVQDPALLFNIGQAYRLAERVDKALAAYKGFLRTAPAHDPNRPTVEARVREIEKARVESRKVGIEPAPVPDEAPPPAAPPAPVETPTKPVAAPETPPEAPSPPPVLVSQPPPAAAPPPPVDDQLAYRTTVGGEMRLGGWPDDSTASYRAFGRMADAKGRVYELGYEKRPLYPMVPAYQYSALYGVYQGTSGWRFDVGALGVKGEWHVGVGKSLDYVALGMRIERLLADDLCNDSDGAILFAMPEGRLKVPVSDRFTILGTGSYRAAIWDRRCQFDPSLLSLDFSGFWKTKGRWTLVGGIGLFRLFDVDSGSPRGGWPNRDNASEQIHFGVRYPLGRAALFADYRLITYNGGTNEIAFGIEFRSRPDAP